MDIRDYRPEINGPIDFNMITHVCVCGSDLFRLVVGFDEFEISTYSTDMECIECGCRWKAPTPIDHPEYVPE